MIRDVDIKPITIANYFLTKKDLTQKKIQKLVYYAYSWFITLNNDSADNITNVLFDETPEAWLHGPVFPSLYAAFKDYNWSEIERIDEEIAFENDDLQSFLEDIWNKFGKYSANELEYMTHHETPWINARKNVDTNEPSNNKISLVDIFNYYNAL